MAKLSVFFQENPKDLPADKYLQEQEPWQRTQLEKFVAELETTRKIEHPDARNLGDGKWSLWVRLMGKDAVNHICYLDTEPAGELSPLANLILNSPTLPHRVGQFVQPRRLEIVGTSSRAGEDPESSNRSPEDYCLLLVKYRQGHFSKLLLPSAAEHLRPIIQTLEMAPIVFTWIAPISHMACTSIARLGGLNKASHGQTHSPIA